ncbi:hypothetical protein ACWDA3_53905 [Nonomuraea rubra]
MAGAVEQLAPPREIYDRPATRYVAGFVGIANEIPGEVVEVSGDRAVLRAPFGALTGVAGPGLRPGAAGVAVWRPEHGRMSGGEPDVANRWRAPAADLHVRRAAPRAPPRRGGPGVPAVVGRVGGRGGGGVGKRDP